jgi:hypothetical protein
MRGGVHKKTYKAWVGLRQRCTNPNEAKFKNYGGRGIGYSVRWEKYEHFLEDMGEAPEGYSLGRIDNDGHYTKANCRWETPIQQANNRRMRDDSTSGIAGVTFNNLERVWVARGIYSGERIVLYRGVSFEEAVAARKLFESLPK